jgi:MoaA/NifB/PqqE/SkfB family radical SAM enzyme
VPANRQPLSLGHRPRESQPPASRKKFRLVQALAFLAGTLPRGAVGSVDVTHRCNLSCSHCYFLKDGYQDELAEDDYIDLLKKLVARGPGYGLICSWVGGEPLLRPGLIERGKELFSWNTVVTNGTIPLPDWRDVKFFVSVDGPEKVHEKIRNASGIYQRIKRNADRDDLNITIATCLNRLNIEHLEPLVLEWARTRVRHMVFDFHTPSRDGADPLWINGEERDRWLDKLEALKKIYGDFIVTPARVYRMMRQGRAQGVTSRCLLAERGFSLDPMGRQKTPCVMGPQADCSRCGCVVPYYLASLTGRREIIRDLVSDLMRKVGL